MDESWNALSQRVKGTLGQALPDQPPGDPTTPEFLDLLTRLRQADPDLAEIVINAYTGTVEPLPSEVEAAAERRRQRLYQRLLARFVRPDGLRTGRVRLNLKKTINYSVAAVAILLIIWSLVPKSTRQERAARRGHSGALQNEQQAILPSLTPSTSSSSRAPRPRPSLSIGTPEAPPLAVSRPGIATSGLTAKAARAPNSPLPARAAMPVIAPVVVFEASNQRGQSAPSAEGRSEGASTQQQRGPVIVYDSNGTQAAGSQLPRAPSTPNATTQLGTTAVSRGQLLEGKLVTPAVVSSSRGTTPTLVEITQGSLQGTVLLGQATRSSEGLVLIQFNGLIAPDGREHAFRGAAYDPELGSVGIRGQTTTMMPDASSALLAATMQSVGDYFTARARQPQVTLPGGGPGGQQGPSLWDGLASAVARAFAPSSDVPPGPAVVTRLDRGHIVTILVL